MITIMSNNYDVKKIVDELLDKIDAVYTDERKTAVRARMNDYWNGIYPDDRFPFVVNTIDPNPPEIPCDVSDFDKELITQLSSIVYRSNWDDDYYPGLVPGVRQVLIPASFGCKEDHASDSVKVVGCINKPEDVYNLEYIGFPSDSIGGEMLKKMKYWREATNKRIMLYEADMQGPFSVACQTWGMMDLLSELYISPDEVHYLMNMTTQAVVSGNYS